MSVGETLAEARSRAGLSVDDLSERTKIRGTVIRSIEQDDYDACGGDLYVRGYVRALAGAVGIDAQPLIRQYDQTHADVPGETQVTHVARIADRVPPAGPDAESPLPATAPDATVADLPVTTADPVADPAATAVGPAVTGTRVRSGRRAPLIAALAVLVLAAAGVAVGLVVAGQHAAPGKNAAAVAQHANRGASAPLGTGNTGNATPTPAPQAAQPALTTPKKAPLPAKAAPVRSLPIALAEAFGPGGLADGDNPQSALFAITPGSPLPWRSHWYATARFGLLKQGTGLLIDMGRRVTISSVRIDLAPYRGASLQIRVGDAAVVPSGLQVAARASDVGGTVRLWFRTPERARYLLIWFTLLPPNGAGQYQASVYHVVVNGHR